MKNILLALAAVSALASPALAEEPEKLLTPWGMAISVGGGVAGFTDETMRDLTDVGGGWNARFLVGTRQLLGIEAAYIGGLQTIDTLGLDEDAQLLSTALEANLRLNFLTPFVKSPIQPYAYVGAGWKRYALTGVDTNTSSVAEDDNLVEIPMGLGVSYGIERFIVDLRGGYRPAWDADLVPDTEEGTGLASWFASLQLGYEF